MLSDIVTGAMVPVPPFGSKEMTAFRHMGLTVISFITVITAPGPRYFPYELTFQYRNALPAGGVNPFSGRV